MIIYISDEAEAIVDAYTAEEIRERIDDFCGKHYDEIEAAWLSAMADEMEHDEAISIIENGNIDGWLVSALIARHKTLWPLFCRQFGEIEDAAIEADDADDRDYELFIGSPDAFSHDWRISP